MICWFLVADRRIVASRSFEADGEILRVGCYEV